MNRKFSVLLFLSCCLLAVFSACGKKEQKTTISSEKTISNTKETPRADSLYEAGRQLYFKRNFDESVATFFKADSLYRTYENWSRTLDSRINIATALEAQYVAADSIFEFVKSGLPYTKKSPVDSLSIANYYAKLCALTYKTNAFADGKFYAEKGLTYLKNIPKDELDEYKRIHRSLTGALIIAEQELFNYAAAAIASKKDIAFSRKHNYKVFDAEMELFTIYVHEGDFENAEKQLAVIENEQLFDPKNIISAFDFYRAKIMLYRKSKAFDKALQAVNELQTLINNSEFKAHFSQWFLTQYKSDIYFDSGAYEKVIAFVENFQVNETYREAAIDQRAGDFLRLSKAYYHLGNEAKWHENLMKSVNLYLPKTQQINNFFTTTSYENARSKEFLLPKMMFKAKSTHDFYQKKNDFNYANIAMHSFEEAHQLLKDVGKMSTEDAFIDAENIREFYDHFLALYHEKWQNNNDKNVFFKALAIGNESKNILVLNELKQVAISKLFHNIPSDLRKQETQLQTTLDSLNFYTSKELFIPEKEYVRKQLDSVKTKLKNNFPAYYQLKYGSEKAVEHILSAQFSGQNVIVYTLTKQHLYILNYNEGKLLFDKINYKNLLEIPVTDLIANLQNFADDSYKIPAQNVFDILLKNYLDTDKPTVLLLDGSLNAIPFDVFKEFSDYEKPFIRIHNLQEKISQTNAKDAETIVFAPFTEKSTAHTFWLPNSLEEAVSIQKTTNAETMIGKAAQKEVFLTAATNYDIIHLATHSKVNEKVPLESVVYFYPEKEQSPSAYTLQAKSLYTYRIDAELVTLSSCESGSGQSISGKGVQSISNAFNYAGAKSTVMSLWKVPDQTTATIMNLFYKNLEKGYDKATALQKAKSAYVAQTDDANFKHPYFWASFVVSGDISPIAVKTTETTTFSNTFIYILAAVFLLVVLFLLFKKRSKKTV